VYHEALPVASYRLPVKSPHDETFRHRNRADRSSVRAARNHDATGNRQPATTFKLALLTPGSINDNGWNAIAYRR
jgi:hypothetical protein